MKETIPSSSITWSEMGKQNIQAEKVYNWGKHARNQPNTLSLEDGKTSAVEHRARTKWTVEMNFALIEAANEAEELHRSLQCPAKGEAVDHVVSRCNK